MGIALSRLEGPPSIACEEGSVFAGLASGDPASLDALLHQYWSPVLSYVRSLIGDPDAAEDIAQEAFLYLWEGRERWRPEGSVRALLCRVARSRALNYLRHNRVRSRTRPLIHALQLEWRRNPTPLQVFEQAELRRALEEAIDALPPRRREVFVLGYVFAYCHVEVARIMGISEQTARNQMSAALADLRRTLLPFLE